MKKARILAALRVQGGRIQSRYADGREAVPVQLTDELVAAGATEVAIIDMAQIAGDVEAILSLVRRLRHRAGG